MQLTTNSITNPTSAQRTDKKFVFSLLFIVVALLLVGIFRHEMWRDELQAWCLARDSASLWEVQQHLRYEGHPISWYVPLFLFTRLTHDPTIMQLFNVFLTSAACYLVLAFAPFTKLQRALFCLGYFPLFEYGIISRSYSLELLILTTFCCLFQFRKQHPWWLFSILILLTCVNAYGLMLAFALTATLLLDYWLERKTCSFPYKIAALGTTLILASSALTVWQMSAPADGYHGEMAAIKEEQPKRFFKSLRAIPIAYAPIPNYSVQEFWNTDLVSKISNEPATYALVVSIVVLCCVVLFTKPAALFLYVIGTGGLVAFSYTHLLGGLRQQGHLFLVLLCSLWVSFYVRRKEVGPLFLRRFSTDQTRALVLTLILILQVVAGIYAYAQDLVRPFSSAKLVARFIKQKGLQNMLIIGSNDHEITPVSGYLDRKIYCPESKTYIGIVVNNTSRHNIEFKELAVAAKNVMDARHVNEALLILNYPLGAVPDGFKVEGLNQFDKSIQGDERFYLYKISRVDAHVDSGQLNDANGQSSAMDRQSRAPNGQSSAMDRQSRAPNGQSIAMDRQSRAPNGQSTAMDRQSRAPSGQSNQLDQSRAANRQSNTAAKERKE
ncbi:MAG TPA: hypothetical protein V6C89_19385 [Drouetiella sp.]|jgi:hypothetical protein